jgi:hypothetical protein
LSAALYDGKFQSSLKFISTLNPHGPMVKKENPKALDVCLFILEKIRF